jgi:HEAT repeat protein
MKQIFSLACVALCVALPARAEEASVLAERLKSPDTDVRRGAAKELYDLGPEAKPAVPDLARALKDSDLFVRRFAAQALGEIGLDARQALPALKTALGDSKKEVVEAAATALGKLGAGGISALTDVIKDRKQEVDLRKAAIAALGTAGASAKDAVPILVEVLKDGMGKKPKKKKDPGGTDLRVEAAVALGDIGPDAKEAVPALQDLAGAKGKRPLKSAARDALKNITGQDFKKKKA